MKVVLVCGSRHFDNKTAVYAALACLDAVGPIRIVHGDCRGADRLADECATILDIPSTPYPADWSLGKRAGPLRTKAMFEKEPVSAVLAFGHGRGTDYAVDLAMKYDIPVVRIPREVCPTTAVG